MLRVTGDLVGSRTTLLGAVRVDSRFAPALINLAVGAYGNGNLAEAERRLRRVIEPDPQEAFPTMWLADTLGSTGRTQEAMELADTVRSLMSLTHPRRPSGLSGRPRFRRPA